MLYNTSMRSMIGFEFSTTEGLIAFIVIVVALVAIIAITATFVLSYFQRKKYEQDVIDSSNTLRIFVVNVKDDKVDYFNSSYLRNRKKSSITAFYNQFQSHDREKLINWVGDLIDGVEDTPKFLEVYVYIKEKKINVPSILEVQKIDTKKQLIYLESHLLKFNRKEHKKGERQSFLPKDLFTHRIIQASGKGTTFCINFFHRSTKTNEFSQATYVDLKNVLSSIINDDIIATEHEFGKVIISNFDVSNKMDQFSFIDNLKSKLNKYLLIESLADEIGFTIGVIDNQINYLDINGLIKNVAALSEYAIDDEQQVVFFSDKKVISNEEKVQQYRTDVETIIQDNKLEYYFQPVVDFSRKCVIGYQSSAVPIDSYFKNINDLKNYALRTEDDKELFSTIVKNSLSRFIQERYDDTLTIWLPISYNEMQFVNRSFGHMDGVSNTNIVLVLQEKELNSIPKDIGEEGFMNQIRLFKSKGYAVSLQLDDDVLNLSPSIYGLFDYFDIPVAAHMNKKNAGSQLPTFQGLIEKLLHYQKPIIATSIPSWEVVELVYKLGINIICSDAIALPDKNVLPVSKKLLTKISNLKS